MKPLQPLQFSIGRVLLLTFLVAVGCAMIAPLIRTWTANRQLVLLAFCIGGLLPHGIVFVLVAMRRRQLEQISGALLLHVQPRFPAVVRAFLFTVSAVPFMSYLFLAGGAMEAGHLAEAMIVLPAFLFFSGICAFVALTVPLGLQLRCYGIVWEVQFMPWDHLRAYYWEGEQDLFLQFPHFNERFVVSVDQKADVQRVLSDHAQELGGAG